MDLAKSSFDEVCTHPVNILELLRVEYISSKVASDTSEWSKFSVLIFCVPKEEAETTVWSQFDKAFSAK
jgi:hypothetical protein